MNKKTDTVLEKLDILAGKIDILITVTAAGAFQSKPLTKSIETLLSLGLDPSVIARILGSKPNIVRAIKSQLGKKTKEEKLKPLVLTKQREVNLHDE